MRHTKIYSLLIAGIVCAPCVVAQTTTNVTIDHTVRRYLQNNSTGEKVSELDRDKYFVYHEDTTAAATDTDVQTFMDEYDVGFGRNFNGPLKQIALSINSSAFTNTGAEINEKLLEMTAEDFTAVQTTALPIRKWVMSDLANNGYINTDFPAEEAGRYVAKYFADTYTDAGYKDRVLPEYYEPLNEPFVRATAISTGEIGGESTTSLDTDGVITLLSEFHKYAGMYIKQTPALANMKVIGYGAAYPSFEVNASEAFMNWNDCMGKFMDIAHEYMDAYSIHIYDGINQTGESSLRSGSNSEALLDMIEAYSYKLEGKIKPHLPSEYGGIDQYSDDKTTYNAQTSDLLVSSLNHILYNLLDRQDNLLFSVMFITGKSTYYITESSGYQSYAAVLFKRIAEQDGTKYSAATAEWEYTPKIHLYDLWKDVKGERIDIVSDNPDIQVAAFNDNGTLYITLSNLDDSEQTVRLLSGVDNIQSVTRRQMKSEFGVGVSYEETDLPGLPSEITLDTDEGTVFVVKLNDNVSYTNEITRTKYFQSSKFLEKAQGTTNYTFNVTDLESGYGRGNIRMSLGDNSISTATDVANIFPTAISVNGKSVSVPTNWRGYDQVTRGSFLGMIDVSFDATYLTEGENTISFTFPSVSDGYLASVVLEVETYVNAIPESVIDNSSFESSDLSAWTPWGVLGSTTQTADNASFGNCLRLEGYTGVTQNFEVEAGTEYTYTFEAKCEAGSELTVTLTDGEEVTNTQIITATEYSTDPYTATFTPQSTTAQVTISLESGKAWIDTMSLIIPNTDEI